MNRTRRHSYPRLLAIAAVVLIAVVAIVIATTGTDKESYTVKAEFKDSSGLRKNSDVKIGGVPGGKISSITLTPRDTAMVTMRLRDGAVPIGTGATADARPVNLLGEKYVDLRPGDLKRTVKSGATIPMSRTGAPVELDEVIDTLDPTTRGRLRVLINEAGVGLRGRGTDFNALLDRMPSSLREGRLLLESFAADTTQLKRVASTGDRVLQSFADGGKRLADLVDSGQRALQVTAQNREKLGSTIDQAPSTLRQLQATLTTLDTAAGRLKPAAAELQRTAPPLTDALDRLPDLEDDARPTLAKVKDVSPDLSRLGKKGTPVVGRLRLPARELQRFSTVFDPLSRVLDDQVNPLLRVMEGWTRTIQGRDAAGHVFRTEAVLDEELLTNLLSKINNGGAQADRPQDPGPSAGAEGTELKRKAQPTTTQAAPAAKAPEAAPAPSTNPIEQLTETLKKPESLIPGVLNTLNGLVNR
ncbi:MlaD family protein [Patulibacter sp.]|uniref:MlaD family protein n=1 Tax=Patulibacter sp. TaxID=1912859 RepID=UPI0027181A4C|nr:MlaD family protein [Patulibacter sp.]MDO9409314.1 MlaD family protein [Patulibacter sp.]